MSAKEFEWQERAACGALHDTSLFISDEDEEPPEPSPEALAYCDHCEVRAECLEFALVYKMVGVWGGTTDRQRGKLRRPISRLRCPGCRSTRLVYENQHEVCLSCGVSWWTGKKTPLQMVV